MVLLPPFLAPVYWTGVGVWHAAGRLDTVTVPSPAGMLSTVYAPPDVVSTPASAVPPDGVTVTVASAIPPPCELDTVPEKVAPESFFGPVGTRLQAASVKPSPATAARTMRVFRTVFTFALRCLVVRPLSFDRAWIAANPGDPAHAPDAARLRPRLLRSLRPARRAQSTCRITWGVFAARETFCDARRLPGVDGVRDEAYREGR
jgi:hypothetical protein